MKNLRLSWGFFGMQQILPRGLLALLVYVSPIYGSFGAPLCGIFALRKSSVLELVRLQRKVEGTAVNPPDGQPPCSCWPWTF